MLELEKEAEGYTNKLLEDWELYDPEALQEAYIAGAEPREKRIAELEDKLANADYQLEGRDNEIRELKAQIEKMKCCYNCSKWNEGLLLCNDSTVKVTTYADYCCEDWEIKEK